MVEAALCRHASGCSREDNARRLAPQPRRALARVLSGSGSEARPPRGGSCSGPKRGPHYGGFQWEIFLIASAASGSSVHTYIGDARRAVDRRTNSEVSYSLLSELACNRQRAVMSELGCAGLSRLNYNRRRGFSGLSVQ